MSAGLHLLRVDEAIVDAFAEATGDRSSIHMDAQYARRSRYRQRVAHGMLPVAVLLSHIYAGRKGRAWLSALTCRFHKPVFLGDNLQLILDQEDAEDLRLSFKVARDGTTLTEGAVSLVSSPEPSPAPGAAAALSRPAEEKHYRLADLAEGVEEVLQITCSPSAMEKFARLAGVPAAGFEDANFLAVLPLSTLIGMSLPGRAATFTDFEAKFSAALPGGAEVALSGRVQKLMAASGRMKLALTWSNKGAGVATGSASTLVNAEAPVGVDCATILRDHSDLGLKGRVALVTGASRGIGEATAKLLAMHGARVAVQYFRGERDAMAIVDDIRAHGGEAVAVVADLRKSETIPVLIAEVERLLGAPEILINNAVGEFLAQSVETVTDEDFLAELQVSVFGMHACCKAVLPHMKRAKRGKIINIGTIVTEMPVSGQSRYITVKSAVVGYSRSLAVELVDSNIQVNVVVPGMTDTSLIAGLPQALVSRYAEESPGGRLLHPIEVAKAIVLLASDWLAPVSGQQLVLNRGLPPLL